MFAVARKYHHPAIGILAKTQGCVFDFRKVVVIQGIGFFRPVKNEPGDMPVVFNLQVFIRHAVDHKRVGYPKTEKAGGLRSF